jgi:hypothetical protein
VSPTRSPRISIRAHPTSPSLPANQPTCQPRASGGPARYISQPDLFHGPAQNPFLATENGCPILSAVSSRKGWETPAPTEPHSDSHHSRSRAFFLARTGRRRLAPPQGGCRSLPFTRAQCKQVARTAAERLSWQAHCVRARLQSWRKWPKK